MTGVHRHTRHKSKKLHGGLSLSPSLTFDRFRNTHRLMKMTGATSTLAVANSLTGRLSVYIHTHITCNI